MSYNIVEQDTVIINHFEIERQARALRAEATASFIANLRTWVANKVSGLSMVGGKTA